MKNIAIKRTNIDKKQLKTINIASIFQKMTKLIKILQKKTSHFFKCGVCQQSDLL